MEFSLFHGLAGLVRVFTLAFGALVLGHTAYFFNFSRKDHAVGCLIKKDALEKDSSILSSPLWQVLLAIVIITFIVSLAWIVLFIFGIIVDSGRTKKANMIYHTICGALLFIAGIIWIIAIVDSTTKRDEDSSSCSKLQAAFVLLAGILGGVEGCVYLIMAFLVWRSTKST